MLVESFFAALKHRFHSDPALVKSSGRLFLGFSGEPLRSGGPYVEATILGPHSDEDTFDKDIETYDVTFTAFSRSTVAEVPFRMLADLTRVFDDCVLGAAEFEDGGMFHRIPGGDAPRIADGVYRASAQYMVKLQRKDLSPVVRGT